MHLMKIMRRGVSVSTPSRICVGFTQKSKHQIMYLFRFAAYKFPKMAGEPSDAADGYGFYYLDSTAKTAFKPSAVSLKLPHNAS